MNINIYISILDNRLAFNNLEIYDIVREISLISEHTSVMESSTKWCE